MYSRIICTITFLLSFTILIQAQCPTGITFSSQAQIDSFPINYPICTDILGPVIISGADITNLDSLAQITSIGGSLTIESNATLTNLTGLDALNALGGQLKIQSNATLTNLSALYALTTVVGNLLINFNAVLASLSGLDNIDMSTISNIQLIGSGNLSFCHLANICAYLDNPANSALISGNAPGCNSRAEVENECATCIPVSIFFSSQAQVDAFPINYPICTEILGQVIIGGADITNLDSLAQITSIEELWLNPSAALSSLAGLNSLEYIGVFRVFGNTTSFNGLISLTTIGDLFYIQNSFLTSFDGLNSLTSIGGNLEIRISNFTSLNGLDSLTSIGGALVIANNDSLTNLDGLNSLTSIGGTLEINTCEALTSLTGLDNIDHTSITFLKIQHCDNLAFCATPSICDYLSDPSNTALILNNAPGCNNQYEVGSECTTESFVTIWKTDNPGTSNDSTITIPIGTGTFDYIVNWGDGTITNHTGPATHTYAGAGIYTVIIDGEFPHLQFDTISDNRKLLSVEHWGRNKTWESMNNSFRGCQHMVLNAIDTPDLSNVTDMAGMFFGASSFNQDISAWDVSSVIDMSQMFQDASAFDQNIGSWDVSSVTDMSNMFVHEGVRSLSILNYDSLLIGWASLGSLQNGVVFGGGDHLYCTADSARQQLIDDYNWTITDDGQKCLFITTWKTDNPGSSNDSTITIPIGTGTFDYTVQWGDGTTSSHTHIGGPATHSYATPGIYEVMITGDFPHINFGSGGDADKLISINQWGDIVWQSMASSFNGCDSLSLLALDAPDLSQVTHMTGMFSQSSVNSDLNHWDVSNVQFMNALFSQASAFDGDISNWDVNQVTNMAFMFFDASSFNQDLSMWGVSQVTNMVFMFDGASSFNQDLSMWDVSQVISMGNMFNGASSFDQDLGMWDVSQVSSMAGMLTNSNLSIENYDNLLIGWAGLDSLQNAVPFGSSSFYCAGDSARQSIIDDYGWSISDNGQKCPFVVMIKTDHPGVSGDSSFIIPTGSGTFDYQVDWGDEQITNNHIGPASHTYATPGTYTIMISGDFPHIQFNNGGDRQKLLSIEQWGLQPWESMNGSFYGCSNLELSGADEPDLSSVTDLSNMFRAASSMNQDIRAWDVSNVTNMFGMFTQATSFNQNIGDWDVSAVTDMSNMFFGASLSVNNYDSLLIGWSSLPSLQSGLFFNAGNSQYCAGGDARALLMSTHGWLITDDGPAVRTNTWEATMAGDWHNPLNWSTGDIPNACDDVIVPSGSTVTIYNGTVGRCNTIDVIIGADLEVEANGQLNVMVPD